MARLDRRFDQLVSAFVDAPDELGLQHQVLRRIADQLKLGTDQQVRAFSGRLAPHVEHRRRVALEVADALVHLRERNLQAVGHGGDLATIPGRATFTGASIAR